MLGVVVTILFSLGATGLGLKALSRLLVDVDPALRFGASGLLGLGMVGCITFPIGLLPGGTHWGLWVVCLASLFGLWVLWKDPGIRFPIVEVPKFPRILFPILLALLAFVAFVAVLAPSDTSDWDTLAYHLAVPKLWIQAGHSYSVPALHHSNFPFAVDNLYIWGLQWGGESGAKAFEWVIYLFGILTLFGFARWKYNSPPPIGSAPRPGDSAAAWWSALVFAGVPVVVWEAGSAYIDVAHGLFAGLGILFAANAVQSPGERRDIWLAGIFIGLAASSKYTGLEDALAVGVVLVCAGILSRRPASGLIQALLVGGVALAIAAPWLVKNMVTVENPVYPFLYEKFGGKDWDQRRADAYRNEQQSFGVGLNPLTHVRSPIAAAHAILGLGYNPGRYVNPGQTEGLGTPLGALGAAVISAMLVWLISGRATLFEGSVISIVLVSLLMWFVLSQQSRYAISFAIPLAVLAGGAVVRLKFGHALAAIAAVQACVTLYLVYSERTVSQLPVVFGQVSAEDFQTKSTSFFAAANLINKQVTSGKVALYDEVFGYLLDVPYMWANPGHSTIINYDSMKTASDYVQKMKSLGFSYAYVNLSPLVEPPDFVKKWLGSMGSAGLPKLSTAERTELTADWFRKYKVLIADAVAQGLMKPVDPQPRSGLLLHFE